MTRLRLSLALLLAWGALLAAAPAQKDAARHITNGIICPCSCGEILTGCTCETGKAMQAYVDREVGAGKSKDQIEAALVSQYGEVILGAPKAKGFNRVVWIAPFAATAAGFAFATFVLLRWVRRRNEEALPSLPVSVSGRGKRDAAATDYEALRARAEEELRRLEE